MHTFKPKKGDTVVAYGAPGIPAVPPVPGPGCVLHSGAPAVQQYHTKAFSTDPIPHKGWSEGGSSVSGVRGKWNGGEKKGELTHTRANPVYNEEATKVTLT